MKWILLSVYCVAGLLVVSIVLALVFVEQTRPVVDFYANHASVLGLLVSIIGFALTMWTVYETLKVSTKAQRETSVAVREARQETMELLERIRIKMMGDTCEQAFWFATEARHAIRAATWLRAAERCHDAQILASRLTSFRDLTDAERISIRTAVENLRSTIAFIEKNRLKPEPAQGMPADKVQAIDSLIDELDKIRSRLQQELLEVYHGDAES